ncbi:hypothetical protein BD779DRAFT_629978 [Infundibulicybe gibba]|nr:hypothetical protein BD779DRAFT_629978 [Infundibulicybe gibba]
MGIFFYGGVAGNYDIVSLPVRALLWDVTDWMFLFGIAVAEVIMIICVWAMWGRGRRMAILLTALVLVVAGVSIIGLIKFPATYTPPKGLPNTLFEGVHISPSGRASINFIALGLLQAIFFLLVLYRAMEYSRNRSSSFVLECFQHGLLYYAVLVVLSVTNLAIILTRSPYDISLSVQRTFHAILSARMLLHLRRSAHQTRGVNTNGTSLASEIVFQHGSGSMGDSMSDRGRLSVI